jgi:hypothetical protein
LMFARLMPILRWHRRHLPGDALRRDACDAGIRWCRETFGQL